MIKLKLNALDGILSQFLPRTIINLLMLLLKHHLIASMISFFLMIMFQKAIRGLKAKRSKGPDVLPSFFYQTFGGEY